VIQSHCELKLANKGFIMTEFYMAAIVVAMLGWPTICPSSDVPSAPRPRGQALEAVGGQNDNQND
jgi:hypothetical protein